MSNTEKIQVAPGIYLSPFLAKRWPEIQKTRRPFIQIKATRSEQLTPAQSSFGHRPLLPKGFPYPMDVEGLPMFLLAQINFREVPRLAPFPESGYLQIYIETGDDLYGMDMEDLLEQTGFKVLFFEESELQDPQTDFSFLDDLELDYLPLNQPFALSFTSADDYMGPQDVRFAENFAFAADLGELTEQLEDEIGNVFPSTGHRMGGYAFFTQADPRQYDEELSDYMLLLQIDGDEDIMWGDAGVGNFFIHPEDLARKEFSRVMYTWDCC